MASIHCSNASARFRQPTGPANWGDDALLHAGPAEDAVGGRHEPLSRSTVDGYVIGVTGAAHPGTVIALHRTISAAVDAGHRTIVIDLSAVRSLGAQTAGLFCGALRMLERRGVTLEIVGGPPRLQRMLAAFAGSPRVTHRAERNPRGRPELVADVAGTDALAVPSTAGTAA